MSHKCAYCAVVFDKYSDYMQHQKEWHDKIIVMDKAKIVPVKTTNRTTKQIVHDMEKTWGAAIFPEVKPWHSLAEAMK